MITEQNYGAHSAEVEMQLFINGTPISITHMGPDFLLVECAEDYPPCEATIFLKVDRSERRWKVRLPNGISAKSRRVAVALAACSTG
jgi:hypothetical protein